MTHPTGNGRCAHWEAGEIEPPSGLGDCAQCGKPRSDVRVVPVRHRGEHRIADGFRSVDHMADWGRSGGRRRKP